MKKFFYYILMAALIGGTIPFTSCSDDDETMNEWNMAYVSLLPVDYLKPMPTFILDHFTGKGIEGTVAIDVMATLQKPLDHDVTET